MYMYVMYVSGQSHGAREEFGGIGGFVLVLVGGAMGG